MTTQPPLKPAALLCLSLAALLSAALCPAAQPQGEMPEFPAVTAAMKEFVAKENIAGAVTVVATRDKIVHCSAVGLADIAAGTPMRPDSIGWIASMTKPITVSAVLMLQDEGKLSVDDPVAKYLPALADLKTADGKPGNLTLRHLLTHTSGMSEATAEESKNAHTLADLIPCFASKPLKFEPGTKWQYCQSGINSLGRIVEVVSGQSFPEFLQKRLFGPLGMKDTGFYPTPEQAARVAKSYKIVEKKLQESPVRSDYDYKRTDRVPMANGGLYSSAPDYVRFCQMILGQGSLDGKQYLKPESVKLMTSIQTGDLKAGFLDGSGWGLGWGVVRQPQGPTAMLSPGTFGHGGAYGTQAWIDPVKQVIYVLMVQRSDFPNSDGSDVRSVFQAKAAEAMAK
ncbi:MAG: serine hydrolase [Planctomycetota bacterium]|nr:serine hydrolase [Planctomycetota bacterium]